MTRVRQRSLAHSVPVMDKKKKAPLIPLRKGTLRKYGYSTHDTTLVRRAALARSVRANSPLKTFRKLNAVMVYNKGRPKLYRTFKADRNWVKRQYMS